MLHSQQIIFKARITQKKELTQGLFEFELKLTQPFEFTPGQYIWLELPEKPGAEGQSLRRAFSIANSPQSDRQTLKILMRRSESEYKKTLMSLDNSSLLRVHGPFGSSFSPAKFRTQPIIIITEGIGISPFLSILSSLKNQPPAHKCTLVFTSHEPTLPDYFSWLAELSNQTDWFKLVKLHRRFSWPDIADVMPGEFPNWWISGGQSFVDDVYETLTQENISELNMIFEQHYPSRKNNLQLTDLMASFEKQDVLAHAIQDSTNHMVITDKNGQILFANQAAEKGTGFTLAEMLGNTPRLWGGMMEPEFYKNFWLRKSLGLPFNGEIINRRKNGEIYFAKAHISPLLDNKKQVIGFIGTEEDLTAIKQRQHEIENLNNRLKLATQAANIGVWEINLVEHNLIWDDQMFALHGVTRADFGTENEASEILTHPDDKNELQTKIDSVLAGQASFLLTYRVIWPNNSVHYLKCYGIAEKDENKKPIKIIGVSFDVTNERQVDRAKTEFVSLASHQLRTPLTAINWYTEMLLHGDVGEMNAEQKKYLSEIYHGSTRMVKLVSSLLNVSRMELGKFAIEPVETDLTKLAENVLKELTVLFTEKGLIVSTENQPLPHIPMDQGLTRIVYTNLLTNAINYTPSGGKIKISHSQVINEKLGDSVRIEVSDTGIGIPLSQQNKIFTKLFRATNAQELDTQGTGLGLYIVKAIVTQAGGEVSFHSTENQGTTFRIDFPLTGMKSKSGSKTLEN